MSHVQQRHSFMKRHLLSEEPKYPDLDNYMEMDSSDGMIKFTDKTGESWENDYMHYLGADSIKHESHKSENEIRLVFERKFLDLRMKYYDSYFVNGDIQKVSLLSGLLPLSISTVYYIKEYFSEKLDDLVAISERSDFEVKGVCEKDIPSNT